MADTPEIDVNAQIEKCPVVQTNVLWPRPVDARLNDLVKSISAVTAGQITRSKLLAALVAGAPSSGFELDKLVREYRALTAGEVLRQDTGIVTLPERRPGRRASGT